jgi:ubiquinone/menaquinone biosynthesis C-methylase UbiE
MARRAPHRLLFDLWSRVYDAPPVQRLTYRPGQDAVLRALCAAPPRRVLDVGCGTGQLAVRLRRELGCRVVGCDFSRGMLGQARLRGPRQLFVQGDAQRLPFADAAFDALVSTEAFHWFPDPDAALAEFRRVLEPGARLLVAFVNPPFRLLSAASRLGSELLGEPFTWPTPGALRRRFERAGFRVLSQQRVLRLPAPFLFPTVLTEALRENAAA